MNFNEALTVSCENLPLYQGEMTLAPHQGMRRSGSGSVALICGAGTRHLQVRFEQTSEDETFSLPKSADEQYGHGTCFMHLPLSEEGFFLFVTSTGHRELIGEATLITGDSEQHCSHFEIYLLNCLTPNIDTNWVFGDWLISSTLTQCSYDLSRVSLPTYELNLTHKLILVRKDQKPFQWSQVTAKLDKILLFFSFINCSQIVAPVVYGYYNGKMEFFRFESPPRTVPTNRRSWATNVSQDDLGTALTHFLEKVDNDFWNNILNRAISWQLLAEISIYDNFEQALFTVQMLLELLSYVLLVEDAMIIGEAGYRNLPASDKITLLCSLSNQNIFVNFVNDPNNKGLKTFCAANSINNIGELITVLRNKLTHPTKKNREYLDRVPDSVKRIAIELGIQVASLSVLKIIDYKGMYFDTIEHETSVVPWT